MNIIDNRKSDARLEIETQEHWMTYILPNCKSLELSRIYAEKIRVNDGFHTDSKEYYVYEYLVWMHDETQPRTYRLKSIIKVPQAVA